jgi:hypothetical protein
MFPPAGMGLPFVRSIGEPNPTFSHSVCNQEDFLIETLDEPSIRLDLTRLKIKPDSAYI